jgi:predicted DNA repair protein MutK
MDDIGLFVAATAKTGFGRAVGTGLVKGMPKLMTILSTIGTAAMLWVGGAIITHGLDVLGQPALYDFFHYLAIAAVGAFPVAMAGFVEWLVTALCDGAFGLVLGLILIPVVTRILSPLIELIMK